jgi:hypothetical protein
VQRNFLFFTLPLLSCRLGSSRTRMRPSTDLGSTTSSWSVILPLGQIRIYCTVLPPFANEKWIEKRQWWVECRPVQVKRIAILGPSFTNLKSANRSCQTPIVPSPLDRPSFCCTITFLPSCMLRDESSRVLRLHMGGGTHGTVICRFALLDPSFSGRHEGQKVSKASARWK